MITEDKFATTYGDVEVMFDPEPHEYHIAIGSDSPIPLPSVSAITDYLPKFGLPKWYEKEAIKGMQELLRRSVRNGVSGDWSGDVVPVDMTTVGIDDPKFSFDLFAARGFGAEAIRDKKAALGTTVHAAFRGWIENGVHPNPKDYTGDVVGYIKSLAMLAKDLDGAVEVICCEQPIASKKYGFAGTPDLFCKLTKNVTLQTGGNQGPGKRPKFTEFKAGTSPLIDLKTSAQVYLSHQYQLTAYQLMLEELGLGTPDERFICLIKPDGAGYNLKSQRFNKSGFLGCLAVYDSEKRPQGWLG